MRCKSWNKARERSRNSRKEAEESRATCLTRVRVRGKNRAREAEKEISAIPVFLRARTFKEEKVPRGRQKNRALAREIKVKTRAETISSEMKSRGTKSRKRQKASKRERAARIRARKFPTGPLRQSASRSREKAREASKARAL